MASKQFIRLAIFISMACFIVHTVKADCGCLRCDRMQKLSKHWYRCCLYCVVNGKRSFNMHPYNYYNLENDGTSPFGRKFL